MKIETFNISLINSDDEECKILSREYIKSVYKITDKIADRIIDTINRNDPNYLYIINNLTILSSKEEVIWQKCVTTENHIVCLKLIKK